MITLTKKITIYVVQNKSSCKCVLLALISWNTSTILAEPCTSITYDMLLRNVLSMIVILSLISLFLLGLKPFQGGTTFVQHSSPYDYCSWKYSEASDLLWTLEKENFVNWVPLP